MRSQSRGYFVTFEGVDGAGKSSHIHRVQQYLQERQIECILTREPGGTAVGESLRQLVLHETMSPRVELLALYAARVQHVDMLIKPALVRGAWVLSDRFEDSSFAYQCQAAGLEWHDCEQLSDWALQGFSPDLTLLFDLPVDVSMARVQSRAEQTDKFEAQNNLYFEKVREGFLKRSLQDKKRIKVIDAQLTEAEVANVVLSTFKAFFQSTST